MDREIVINEIKIFFQIAAELRAIGRKPQPSGRKLRYCLDEIAAMAMFNRQPKLATRCRALLEDFASRSDHARLLLSELNAHVTVYC